MYIDFKIITWERVQVPKDIETKVLNLLKSGLIDSADDIYTYLTDTDELSCNTLEDASEQMSVDDNDGCSTIEVYKDGEVLYENSSAD